MDAETESEKEWNRENFGEIYWTDWHWRQTVAVLFKDTERDRQTGIQKAEGRGGW